MIFGGRRYDPRIVARLAREGRIVSSKRVAQWLQNHDYEVGALLSEVLVAVERRGRYIGSCKLVNDEAADEYVVDLGVDDWYVKFWIDEDQVIVNVWSCWWDGTAH